MRSSESADGKPLILLVEEEVAIQEANDDLLTRRGYRVHTAYDLSEARRSIALEKPDIIVLDIMLPDGSGLDLMRELRMGEDSDIPILLLSGLGTADDIVVGLAEGGDDYLAKPYDNEVLLARIDALLRRTARVQMTFSRGPFDLDLVSQQAYQGGVDMLLSKKEFGLLLLFLQHEEETLSAEHLYEQVWKQPMSDDPGPVKFQVSRLRTKLGDSGYSIITKRGEGYSMVKDL